MGFEDRITKEAIENKGRDEEGRCCDCHGRDTLQRQHS